MTGGFEGGSQSAPQYIRGVTPWYVGECYILLVYNTSMEYLIAAILNSSKGFDYTFGDRFAAGIVTYYMFISVLVVLPIGFILLFWKHDHKEIFFG